MKRLTLLIMLMFVVGLTFGQTLKMSYNFEKPIIKTNKSGYSHLIYDNCMNFGEEGNPSIPFYGADILLAQNSEIKSVKIISKKYYDEVTGIKIKPAVRQLPLSKPNNDYKVIPNDDIYNSNNIYPENKIESINTSFLCGHSIGSFTICPIEYTPSQNKVQFLKSIEIEIILKNTTKASNANRFLRTNSNIENRINKIVDNPEMLNDYSYTKDFSEYDILLISNNTLLPEFQDYIDFKMSTGFIVATQTVEDIYSSYSGADNQEKIRNCVIDYYDNFGITYVILGGDIDPSSVVVPHRGFFATVSTEYTDDNIPSDMYYACLDGSWNDDGDNRWGEIGEDDLYAEVSIGRICVDNASEIENHTHKLYMYQNEPVIADIEKALMVGESLWTGIWGKMYKTQIETGGTFNGYTTVGISDNFSIEQLYQQDGSWSKNQLYNQFNSTGINLLNHLGHSGVHYCMTLSNSDISTTNIQNNGVTKGYGIVYSQGCYCGSFDNRNSLREYSSTDCFSEAMSGFVNGTVAMITNSRYGWGDDTGTNGASQYFDRQFYDAIFGEDITIIGDANADSKEDNAAYFTSQQVFRWCTYELTLFGDPTMDIWTATPTDMTVSYNSSVSIGTSQITFTTDAPFARVGLMQNGELIGRAVADGGGNATVDLFEPISSDDDISVSIIAHNKNRHLGTITVFSDEPYVVYNSKTLSGSPDYNQSIDLTVAMKNVGTVNATGVVITLSVNDENITITDATETYGDFDAGQTIEITDAFAFDISDDVPDQHSVLFTLTATTSSYDWESTFSIVLNAPVPQVAFKGINDEEGDLTFTSSPVTVIDEGVAYNYDISVLANGGNGDGLLDPGETVSVTVDASNVGHTNFHNVICTLTSTNQYVTINTSENNLETIIINETKPAVFSITIDEDTPPGEVINLTFTLTGGEYTEVINVNISVGLIVEDFETGDFNNYDWTTSNWIITTDDVYEGTYSSKSDIYHQANSNASIEIDINVTSDGTVSFYKKVSCENGGQYNDWDYLEFLIDGARQELWEGEVGWSFSEFNVTAGNHTLKWNYHKDEMDDNGSDCAWVDYITLPAFTSKSGGKSITITAPTLPSWLTFNDNGNGTADLYGTAPNEQGLHDVVIEATGAGEPATQEFQINVGQVSIQTKEGVVNIYPNPTSSILNITVPNVSDNNKVVISDITGKILLSKKITNNSSSIDLSNFATGTYMLRLTLGNETITQKVIVK